MSRILSLQQWEEAGIESVGATMGVDDISSSSYIACDCSQCSMSGCVASINYVIG